MKRSGLVAVVLALASLVQAEPFTLTVLHTNDMHAHVEATRTSGKTLGGYARLATLIAKFRASDPNVVLLNAGDVFQGTIYFNTYNGLADLAFMNAVRFDAMALGNHEFDKGVAVLADFANGAAFPVLAANLDVTREPLLNKRINLSATVRAGTETIGVVGAVTDDLPTISFLPETVTMRPTVAACQSAIDAFKASGIDKILLLSHCGYREEQELAKSLSGVDIVVGGHSHTLLGSTGIAGLPTGPAYPTVVKNKDGDTALVVQAWQWGMVLGRLKVVFDDAGRVASWSGAPVAVTDDLPEDPLVASIVKALSVPIAAQRDKVVGTTRNALTRGDDESLMANLIADAQLEATRRFGSVAAFINSGGVRSAIEQGEITYGEALQVQPFGNTLVVIELTGAELLAALQRGAGGGGMLHPSHGTSYTIANGKVTGVTVDGKPLDVAQKYMVTVNNFTAGGGDNHVELKAALGKRTDTGIVDIDAFVDYITRNSPLERRLEGRIKRSQESQRLRRAG